MPQTRDALVRLGFKPSEARAAIDVAMHLVRIHRLGIPQETREAFERGGLLEEELAARMKKMVGFRNVAVHDYRKLDLEIVRSIVSERLDDFLHFGERILRAQP